MSAASHRDDLVVEGDARRRRIRERHGNGIAAVEVREHGRRLLVFFLARAPRDLDVGNIRIDAPSGGRVVHAVDVTRRGEEDVELEDRTVVELDHAGSAGAYRLSIVERDPDGSPSRRPYRGLDERYAAASFVFDVDAPGPPILGAPTGAPSGGADISYLLRDYEGLRQLMLDRLAVTIPDWSERHIPDSWITLIELLAYRGDDLSYYEDAVATEAFLQTARRRISIRRHARLVDYRLHEGCSARAWVCMEVERAVTLPLRQVRFAAVGSLLEKHPPTIDATRAGADALADFPQYSPLPAHLSNARIQPQLDLVPAHNAIELWAWGERDSHLVAGATSAVLVDPARPRGDEHPQRALRLTPGDVLVLEETRDPRNPDSTLADPTHRQAVRLTDVHPTVDELYGTALLEVRWAPEDALAFDLAVRVRGRGCSRASGNVVLVAHGVTVAEEVHPAAPRLTQPPLSFSTAFPDPEVVARGQARRLRVLYASWRRTIGWWRRDALRGEALSEERLELLRRQLGDDELERLGITGRYGEDRAEREADGLAELLERSARLLAGRRRRLEALAELAETYGPLDDVLIEEVEADWGPQLGGALYASRPGTWGAASEAILQDPPAALPLLELVDAGTQTWSPALDLIGAAPDERAVVAEVDDVGVAALRLNAAPADGALRAFYRVGNGRAGNAEVEAINAIVWDPGDGSRGAPPAAVKAIKTVRNALPASGGVEPEDASAAKLAIPGAFLEHQRRALTVDDYISLATEVPGVRRAAAQLRSTGSLAVVDVAIQPTAGEDPRDELLERVHRALETARRIGHVVRVQPPRYRPLEIALDVALAPSAVRADVASQLARLLSSGWLPDGTPALFSPTRLAFATTVHSSPIIAAVHAIAGVRSGTLTRFGFLGDPAPPPDTAIAPSLRVGAMEIVRLDNDPTTPGNGYAVVTLEGGR